MPLPQQLPIRVETNGAERPLGEVLELARTHGLSTYDGRYLDLAMRLEPQAGRGGRPVRGADFPAGPVTRPAGSADRARHKRRSLCRLLLRKVRFVLSRRQC